MTRGVLITFSGVDLAGKSTQLARTRQWLTESGYEVRCRWHRPGYSPGLDRARALVRALRPGALPPAGASPARERAFGRPGVRASWIAMACADTVVQHGMRTRADLAGGSVVLCDRYVQDGMIDLALRFRDLPTQRLGALLSAICPKPDLAVLLMLPWDEIQRRLATKAEPFPDREDVRRARYDAYQRLAATGQYAIVPAEGSVDEVQVRIRKHIERLLQRREEGSPRAHTFNGGAS